MKRITTVTKKGQVTIPLLIREKLQIGYGDKVEFTLNKQDQVVLQPVKTDLNNLYGILEKKGPGLTPEEQRQAAREWISEKKGRS